MSKFRRCASHRAGSRCNRAFHRGQCATLRLRMEQRSGASRWRRGCRAASCGLLGKGAALSASTRALEQAAAPASPPIAASHAAARFSVSAFRRMACQAGRTNSAMRLSRRAVLGKITPRRMITWIDRDLAWSLPRSLCCAVLGRRPGYASSSRLAIGANPRAQSPSQSERSSAAMLTGYESSATFDSAELTFGIASNMSAYSHAKSAARVHHYSTRYPNERVRRP